MIVYLPDPFAAQLCGAAPELGEVRFRLRDAAHRDALEELVSLALRRGFALELRLIHYYGEPDAIRGRAAQKAGQKVKQQ